MGAHWKQGLGVAASQGQQPMQMLARWGDLFLERGSEGLTASDGNVSLKVRTRAHLASCLQPPERQRACFPPS